MTQDEVIAMAREAGFDEHHAQFDLRIERFVKLVAAKATASEREACALIAETPIYGEQDDITMEAKDRVAAAIRARGDKHD
jgi:hypothetical protein